MKRKIIFITMGLMIAFMTTSCMKVSSGSGGMTVDGVTEVGEDGIPSNDFQLTDVGNPEETDEHLKTYVNPEFEVKINYPGKWNLVERGTEEADFTSENVDITASFFWLEDDETFEDFLVDWLGDISGLNGIAATPFDETRCAEAEEGDGVKAVECYHYYEFAKGTFVAAVSGFIASDTVGFDAWPFGVKKVDHKMIAEATKDLNPRPVDINEIGSDVPTVRTPVVERPVITAPIRAPKPVQVVLPVRVVIQN